MKTFYIAFAGLLLGSLAGCGGGGGNGGGTGGTGITADTGRIYVVDSGNDRIVRMDNINGDNWTSFGTQGSGVNQFNSPRCITFDAQGRMYIADADNGRIIRMDDLTGAGWIAYGEHGSGQGQFSNPNRIAIDGNGRIYVADSWNNRIVRIDDMSGTNWTAFGTQGNGANQFDGPYGLWVGDDFRIYVCDSFNGRIVRFDNMSGLNWTVFTYSGEASPIDVRLYGNKMLIDDRDGRVILTDLMSTNGWKEIQMDTPQSAAMGSGGGIYVVDQSVDLLSRFSSIDGGTPQTYGSLGQNEFNSPSHVALGP